MVDFNPREGELNAEDALVHENRRLKEALHILLTRITSGSELVDIQTMAAKLAVLVEWPYAALYTEEEKLTCFICGSTNLEVDDENSLNSHYCLDCLAKGEEE